MILQRQLLSQMLQYHINYAVRSTVCYLPQNLTFARPEKLLPSLFTRRVSLSMKKNFLMSSGNDKIGELDVEEQLVKDVHESPSKAVVYVTGGATAALPLLLAVPGASRTVLEAAIPYSETSAALILGHAPRDSYTSIHHSSDLAAAAYKKAAELTGVGEMRIIGIAASCSLAIDRVKRGDHVCCVSVHQSRGVKSYRVKFKKGARSRKEEDFVSSQILIRALAEATGVLSSDATRSALNSVLLEEESDSMECLESSFHDPVLALLAGEATSMEFTDSDFVFDAPRRGALILPGSFNPLHEGHLQMMRSAEELTGKRGVFEISVVNADKGQLSEEVVRRRLGQFKDRALFVVLTSMPLFTNKSEAFPRGTFLVGYDTAVRIIDPKYYSNSETEMFLHLERIRSNGCQFLVAGRRVEQNSKQEFLTVKDLKIPIQFRDMFAPLEGFRLDLSSTEIRHSQ